MKNYKSIPLLFSALFLLSACRVMPHNSSSNASNNSEKTSQIEESTSQGGGSTTSEDTQPVPTDLSVQQGTILHAWNWSIANVKSELDNIKNAGYTTIQLSPLQPQKDYYQGESWSSQWWKLYQPLGLCVANGNNQNVLGTKSELTSLCSQAKAKGLKIIVDVVTNHLAGGNKTTLNNAVGNYESVIKNNNLIHTYGQYASDTNLQSIVQGNIGDFPDLKTEDSRVQERVISMLKEYVDCGIDGFRFDAAKHIETPEDGNYKSNYWPNVTNAINAYAEQKHKDKPYIYGEILNTVGTSRSWASYTNYMSVIDNKQGWDLLTAVRNGNASSIKKTYNTGVNADHLVLWGESHDMYSNDSGYDLTKSIDASYINKAYMIQASRKDATSLYFVRPGSAKMGNIGTTDYKSNAIKGANLFHNANVGRSESFSNDGSVFINTRGGNAAALINLGSSNPTSVNVSLPNGSYKELITGRTITVNNGSLTPIWTDGACFIVSSKQEQKNVPSITFTTESGNQIFGNQTSLTIDVKNATSSSYTINNGASVSFTGSTAISFDSSYSNGDIVVKVTASNSDGTVSKSYTLFKTSLYMMQLIVKNVPSNVTMLAWEWKTGQDGAWYEFQKDGSSIYGINLEQDNFILVTFPTGTTKTNANWDNKISQTGDMAFTEQLLDYNSLGL